jgi:hypothetical protein
MTGSHTYRIPAVVSDAAAGMSCRMVCGGRNHAHRPEVAELAVTPAKIAALTVIVRAGRGQHAGRGLDCRRRLARAIARKVDAAVFSSLASPAPDASPT